MSERPDGSEKAGGYDPSRAEANRERLQGLGMGARDLDRQQDPAGSGAGTPEGQGGDDGVERLEAGDESQDA